MIDIEALQRVLRYDKIDKLAYIAWVLSQPKDGDLPEAGLRTLRQLKDAKTHGTYSVFKTERLVLLPSGSGPPASPEYMRAATELEPLIPVGTLWDGGYRLVAVIEDNHVLVLLEDGSWAGPVTLSQLPDWSDEAESFYKSVIPYEVEAETDIDLDDYFRSDDVTSELSAAVEVTGYGPHIGVVVVGGSPESAYEALSTLQTDDPRWADDRQQAWEFARDHARERGEDPNGDAAFDYYMKVLGENTSLFGHTLEAWEAASVVATMNMSTYGIAEIQDPDHRRNETYVELRPSGWVLTERRNEDRQMVFMRTDYDDPTVIPVRLVVAARDHDFPLPLWFEES